MASKKEVFEGVIALLTADGGVSEATMAEVTELLKPKVGGGKANPEDYTVFGPEGDIVYIYCNIHKKWEPVVGDEDELLFKEDAKSKNGFRRYCIEGDKQWHERAKAFKASKDAIMQDLLDGEITGDAAKELIAASEAERKAPFTREDGVGEDEKPELA